MSESISISEVLWESVIIGAGVIFLVVVIWVLFELLLYPARGTIDQPDASAFVRGKCGDSMKLSMRFSSDRVVDAKYWTDGCRMSGACGAAAARLALNKTPEEIADIDHGAIEKEVGGLADEDRHCATLAAATLQEALRAYLQKPDASDPVKDERPGAPYGP